MELENQVPTLELCKKLKELDYPQEGLFWWKTDRRKERVVSDKTVQMMLCRYNRARRRSNVEWEFPYIVAPTVAELGEYIKNWFNGAVLRDTNGNYVSIMSDDICKTEANARAKCLIWLAKNNYIDFKENK